MSRKLTDNVCAATAASHICFLPPDEHLIHRCDCGFKWHKGEVVIGPTTDSFAKFIPEGWY